MVRKRSRKHYDSDENDSDSDYALDDPPYEPAPKKYSLRQRKRPLFTEDFDYDEDGEEIAPPKVSSDDEDFEVEKELELDEAADTEYVDKTTYINHYEPETDDMPEDADGLIDFEDMIRADIVVNKNRIDYDNIIQKTEIKVQPIEEPQQPVKSKRGRKPKIRPVGEIDSSILEPETEVQEAEEEDKNDKDYNPEDDAFDEEPILADCEKAISKESQAEGPITENDNLPNIDNPPINSTNPEENETATPQKEDEVKTPDNISGESNVSHEISQESVIKVNDGFVKDLTQVNGNASPDHLNKPEEKLLEITKQEITENEDDDVVLVEDEKRCEVIVLDD